MTSDLDRMRHQVLFEFWRQQSLAQAVRSRVESRPAADRIAGALAVKSLAERSWRTRPEIGPAALAGIRAGRRAGIAAAAEPGRHDEFFRTVWAGRGRLDIGHL